MVEWMIRDLEGTHDWKISDKEVWGRHRCVDLSEWAKNVKIFVSHVNLIRMTSAEKDFNNQVEWNYIFFPQLPCHDLMGHEH